MSATRAAAAALATAALAGCASGGPPEDGREPPAAAAARLAGTVERVIDGDTLIARIDGRRVRVRLLGVDAPDTAGYGSAECYGPEAADAARGLLPRGARLALRTDPTQGREDRFGRLLAEVTVAAAARTVNEALVGGGSAEVFRGDGRGRLQPRLRALERRAREGGLGLWGSCGR
ncbi:MAG TPA: thermonuclease family protein [Miltoncostaeaceae bacterium]|nr:thermonuclease family protein [Miltoncostaeaceae bacterium]